MAKRGRPRKIYGERGRLMKDKADETVVHTVATEDDVAVAGVIADAKDVDEKEWEKVFLDIKARGNYFDLVRNMYPFQLPGLCQLAQETKQKKYGWIGRENMEIRCDSSRIIYWTPVNKTNHPDLPGTSFNKNGGVCREGMYLCFMPWRMYEARCEIEAEKARLKYEEQEDLYSKEDDFASHYKPKPGPGGATVFEEATIEHPEESYRESGEYVG